MTNSTLMKSLFILSMGWMAVSNTQAGTPFKAEGNHIPGTIEAEDYDTDGWDVSFHWSNDQYEAKKNSGGNYREDYGIIGGPQADGTRWLGELDGGTWTIYTVTVAAEGDYDLDTYYSKGNDGSSSFTLTIGDVTTTVSLPGTGAWETFTSYTTTYKIHLTAGTYEMKFETGGGFNIDKFVFKEASAESVGRGFEIPGKIEAEDFDFGGEGVAYHWNDGYTGGADYRDDAPHIGDGGTGHNIGWTANGDWAKYTVDVKQTGFYRLTYSAASGADNGGSFYFADKDGANALTKTCVVKKTANWDTYEEFSITNVYLEAGQQTLRWVCGGGFNIDYFNFEYIGEQAEVTAVVPGTIEAEDYDEGTEVFRNVDKAPGFAYRPNQKVYLEKNGDRITIGNTSGGNDQFSYTFIAEAGTYTIDAYVACGNDTGKFKITIDESYDSGETAVPNVGWGNYDTPISLTGISLTAGQHTMTFFVLGDCNIDRFVFTNTTPNAISDVQRVSDQQPVFNLQGQRVAQPRHGLYIQNGKKYIAK